jgi:hypothetical protein
MIAKTYIRNCKCKPKIITKPLTYTPKCLSCGKLMIEGDDE